MVIYKYPLKMLRLQSVEFPAGAKILSVANQNGTICLWASILNPDPDAATRRREIEIIGTGDQVSKADRTFIGTVLVGAYVWHVFERM